LKAISNGLNTVSSGALGLTILLMPLIALAGGLGFQVTGCLLGVLALLALVFDPRGSSYLLDVWVTALIVLVGWAWISTAWSPYNASYWGGNASILFGLVFFLLFMPLSALRLGASGKARMTKYVIAAGLLGVILLLVDSASGFAVSLWVDPVAPGGDPELRRGNAEMNVGRGQVSYLQILWPVAALLIVSVKRGWILAVLCFIGLAVSAQLNNLAIIIPSLVLAAAFAGLAWRNSRLGLILAFSLAIASIALAPFLSILCGLGDTELLQKLPLSWEHRVRMWTYSGELIQQSPWIGHGFDASRVYDDLTFRAPDGRDIVVMSLHPHNVGLQLWLETGLVGVFLAVGFLLALMKSVLRVCTDPAQAFAASGLIVTVTVSGAAAVGLWQHWWWALIVLAVSLISLIPSKMNAI